MPFEGHCFNPQFSNSNCELRGANRAVWNLPIGLRWTDAERIPSGCWFTACARDARQLRAVDFRFRKAKQRNRNLGPRESFDQGRGHRHSDP